jgi:hypothetical protein
MKMVGERRRRKEGEIEEVRFGKVEKREERREKS